MKLFRFGVTCYVFKAHKSSSFSRVWQIKFDKSRVGKEKKKCTSPSCARFNSARSTFVAKHTNQSKDE